MAFNVGDAAIDLTLEGAAAFNSQCEQAKAQLAGLQGGLAASDTKAKGLLVTLREFQSGTGLSMLIRGGIYGILAAGAIDAFTAMHKAAREGASSVEVLSKGIYGLVTSLPLVGRLTTAFKKLADEISGVAEEVERSAYAIKIYAEVQKISEELKYSLETIGKTPFEIGRIDAAKKYREELQKISDIREKFREKPEPRHAVPGPLTPWEQSKFILATGTTPELMLRDALIAKEKTLADIKKKEDEDAKKRADEISKKAEDARKKEEERVKKVEAYITTALPAKQKAIAEEVAKAKEELATAANDQELWDIMYSRDKKIAAIEEEFAKRTKKIKEEAKMRAEQISDGFSLYTASEKNQAIISENIKYREIQRNLKARYDADVEFNKSHLNSAVIANILEENLAKDLASTKVAHLKYLANIEAEQQKKDAEEAERLAKKQFDLNMRVIELTKGAKTAQFERDKADALELLKLNKITQKEAAEHLGHLKAELDKDIKERGLFGEKETRAAFSMSIVGIESAWSQLATLLGGGKEAATELTQREIATATKEMAADIREITRKTPSKKPTEGGVFTD